MSPRGVSFSVVEIDLLIENYDKTLNEIEEVFRKAGYSRSKKSLARKLEKLREEGKVGLRSKETVQRAHRQKTEGELTEIEEEDEGFGKGFDSDDSFGSGFDDEGF